MLHVKWTLFTVIKIIYCFLIITLFYTYFRTTRVICQRPYWYRMHRIWWSCFGMLSQQKQRSCQMDAKRRGNNCKWKVWCSEQWFKLLDIWAQLNHIQIYPWIWRCNTEAANIKCFIRGSIHMDLWFIWQSVLHEPHCQRYMLQIASIAFCMFCYYLESEI